MGRAPNMARGHTPHAPENSWLDVDVVVECADWSAIDDVEASVVAASQAVARHSRFEASDAASVCIALSDDAAVKLLNRTYRHMDKPTNVLSFPAGNTVHFECTPRLLGDVVLAAETLIQEAAQFGILPRHHLQHLVVHGLLHLLGLEHDSETKAAEMEGLETEILATLGIANPYAREAGAAPLRERLG